MPDHSENNTPTPGLLRRLLDMSPDVTGKTLTVAVLLCLVASVGVSSVAVMLRPMQEANKLRDRQINILQVAGQYEPDTDIDAAFAAFEPQVLELATGAFSTEIDPATFDDRAALQDPELTTAMSVDPASIGRLPKYRTIYLLRDANSNIDKVILPIHGYGLWSTLYGYVAVQADGNEISGLQFYEHGETPGLGAEVDNPNWKALWRGKKITDATGEITITVAKTAPAAGTDYHVDSLSGATLTSVGVDNLVRFWLGDDGYGPFLDTLRKETL
ncbi:MAG: Na(+)-translocating NADH-quinone reductase subunit C [Pseudomonadota bacterium]